MGMSKIYKVHVKYNVKDYQKEDCFLWNWLSLSVAEVMLLGEVVLSDGQLR